MERNAFRRTSTFVLILSLILLAIWLIRLITHPCMDCLFYTGTTILGVAFAACAKAGV